MKLTLLGTGNAFVTQYYNTCFALSGPEGHMLVDAGGGNTILRQLKLAGLDWHDIRHIFVTHKHVDHLMGIVWLVRIICQHMNQGQYDGDATMYGHDEVLDIIRRMSDMLFPQKITRFIGTRLHLVELTDGFEFDAPIGRVQAFDIHSTKAKQYGFCLRWAGKKLTCCGDEPCTDVEQPYAQDSDWLLHEAFCLHGQADIFHPYEKHHSTVKDACELAQKLNIRNLILYHTEDKSFPMRKELYLAEGKQYYTGNLFVPDDLEEIEL